MLLFSILICLFDFLVTNLVIPFAIYDTIPTTRATTSQNKPANDDVPPQYEDVPLMSTKRLYSYRGTLARLVKQ